MSRSFPLAVFPLVLLVAPSPAQDKKPAKKPPFTIGQETTRITEPVDKEGFIDYAAALNDLLSKGVVPEKNAVVLLARVYGPRPEGATLSPEFYKRLGIDPPPEKGDYLVRLEQFITKGKRFNPEEFERFFKQEEELSKRPWKTEEAPEIAAWLKAMDGPLNLGTEAARRPQYYHPLIPQHTEHGRQSLITCLVPYVQKGRELAWALTIRAMLHLGEGREDAAWQDLMAAFHLARHSSHGASLIENLVGVAQEHVATESTLAFLDRAKLSPKQLRTFWKDWQSLPSPKPMRANIDLMERFTALDAVLLMQRLGPDVLEGKRPKAKPRPMIGFQWDLALKNINRFYDRIIAALEEEDFAARREKVRKIEADLHALAAKTRGDNPLAAVADFFTSPEKRGERIGNILICLLIPAVAKVQEAEDRTIQLQRNLHIAFALAAHRLEEGAYPKKLSDLAPKYLEKAPSDLFTGKELVYRPEGMGYVLYSVGPNGKDDGGRAREDAPPGDDVVVRMPRGARGKGE